MPPPEAFDDVRMWRKPGPEKDSLVHGFVAANWNGILVGTAVFAAAVPASARAAVTSPTENRTRDARTPHEKLQRSCHIPFSPRFEARALTRFWPINRGGGS